MKIRRPKKLPARCLLALAASLAFGLATAAAGVTISVPTEYNSIQDAIDAANDGDTVVVAPGTYEITEPIDFNRLHDPDDPESPPVKNITLQSQAGQDDTIIRMAAQPTDPTRASVVIFEHGESRDSTLEGFTLTGGTGTVVEKREDTPGVPKGALVRCGGGVLMIDGASATLSSCTIEDNSSELQAGDSGGVGGGVFLGYSGSPILVSCTLRNNTTHFSGGGVFIWGSDTSVTVSDCVIEGNTAQVGDGGGIYCGLDSRLEVSGSTISENTANVNAGGVQFWIESSGSLRDCVIDKNTALTGAAGGIHCDRLSDLEVSGCTVSENTCAQSGGGIVSWDGSTTSVTDCTIRGNIAVGDAHSGGGLFCGLHSTLNVSRCAVFGNTAGGHGAGVHYYNFGSGTITECEVRGNHALTGGPGGIGVTEDSTVDIDVTTIEENVAGRFGGGVTYYLRSMGTVQGCVIRRNISLGGIGGGVVCAGDSTPRFKDCVISANAVLPGEHSGFGGGLRLASNAVLESCVIEGNYSADVGGGVDMWNASPCLVNCILSCNFAESWGGAVAARGSTTQAPAIVNSTIANNRAATRGGVAMQNQSQAHMINSILWANSPESAEGTQTSCLVGEDPHFVAEPVDDFQRDVEVEIGGIEYLLPDYIVSPADYHLSPDSPAVDMGDSSLPKVPEVDIEETSRPQGKGVDAGAYESEAVDISITFRRGDTNSDGATDIADPVYALNHLFGGGPPPSCLQTADSNDDNAVDIADPVYQLNHLFGGGPALPAPVGECGADPTPAVDAEDDLTCEANPPCEA